MAHWLYTLRPTRPEMLTEGASDDESRSVAEHFAYLKRLVEEGRVLLVGRTQDAGPETRGLVIFESETEDEAREIMEGDPAVRQGVMHALLQPYAIALAGRIPPTPEGCGTSQADRSRLPRGVGDE